MKLLILLIPRNMFRLGTLLLKDIKRFCSGKLRTPLRNFVVLLGWKSISRFLFLFFYFCCYYTFKKMGMVWKWDQTFIQWSTYLLRTTKTVLTWQTFICSNTKTDCNRLVLWALFLFVKNRFVTIYLKRFFLESLKTCGGKRTVVLDLWGFSLIKLHMILGK